MSRSEDIGPILVTGATGKQGGATARALLTQGVDVRVLVRNPESDAAIALQDLGASLVIGDLDDQASLNGATADIYGVFAIQNPDFADLDADTERVRGRNLIEAARANGVVHFVQTSVTGAGDYYRAATDWRTRNGDMNSMVSKGYIEDLVREAGFPYWTILKPAFFMENLPFIRFGNRLVTAYAPRRPLPIITVEDIGTAAAQAFLNRERFTGASIELAGDLLTMPQIAEVLSTAWKLPIGAPAMTPAEVVAEGMMPAMVVGQEWHNAVGLPARPDVARSWGLQTTGLAEWAHAHLPSDINDLHKRLLVLDGHVDILLPTSLPGYFLPDGSTRADFDKLISGQVNALVLSVAAGPGPRDAEGVLAARTEADAKLAWINTLLSQHPTKTGLALTPDDVLTLKAANKVAVIIGFQNTRIIGDDLPQLDHFYQAGVRIFGFCHAGHNSFADSARPLGGPEREHGGLSDLGRQGIKWLNDRGALIDVAQLSKEALIQAVALSRAPVVATHANARSLVDIARNLSDEELDAIKSNGGVVMLTPFAGYLTEISPQQKIDIRAVRERHGLPGHSAYPADHIDRLSEAQLLAFVADLGQVLVIEAAIDSYIDHIDYVVGRIGIDHVGIGTDFNHGAGITGFADLSEAPNLTRQLMARGYAEADIAAIWGQNFLRVWRAAQQLGLASGRETPGS